MRAVQSSTRTTFVAHRRADRRTGHSTLELRGGGGPDRLCPLSNLQRENSEFLLLTPTVSFEFQFAPGRKIPGPRLLSHLFQAQIRGRVESGCKLVVPFA